MTLDEAIKHCKEVIIDNLEATRDCKSDDPFALACAKCADEHRQLAEWLKELKAYKEQSGDAISRNDVIDTLNNMHRYIADELTLCSTGEKFEGDEVFIVDDVYEEIAENLPSVTSQQETCIQEKQANADKIDAVYIDGSKAGYSQARFDLEQEQPVTPQPKMGRWIPLEYDGYADGNPVWDKWECSKCGWEHSGDEESLTAFCPNCGVKMESEE